MTGQVKAISETGSFATRLRSRMFELRMGTGRLARESGVDERLIRKYRAGSNVPRNSFGDPNPNALALADALGVSAEWLLFGESGPDLPAAA